MSGQGDPVRIRISAATQPRLRRDIQALRALAVLLVIANHMLPGWVPGGYLGVDVFFVISGYLITSHLLREVDATGRVNVLSFWARRLRRLIPAAMVVLVACVALTLIWLPITVRQAALEQIAAAGAYVLNWMLAAISMDYFSAGAASSPVTHYWSLSVEEQFYIAWPLLIMGSLLLARGRSVRTRGRVLAGVLWVVFVLSLAWGIYSSTTNAAAAYFETTGRAWEFAAGGLLSFIPVASHARKAVAAAGVWLAWGALVAAAFVLNAASGFPGAAALIPIVATAVIIWIGDVDHKLAPTRLTSWRPVQFLGEISYSLYLWHWPLILATTYMVGRYPKARELLVVLAATIVLAYLTKRFVEDPFRQSQLPHLSRLRWVYGCAAAMMALLLTASFMLSARMDAQGAAVVESMYSQSINADGCFGAQAELSGATCADSHQLADPAMVLLTRLNQNNDMYNGSTCVQGRFPTKVTSCSFGVPAGTEALSIALVGDSHAHVWSADLNELTLKAGLRVHTYLASGCTVTADPSIEFMGIGDTEPSNLAECRAWRDEVIKTIALNDQIDIVVTTARDRAYGTVTGDTRTPDSGSGYVTAWSTWLDAGKRVVVINDTPLFPFDIPTCLAQAQTLDNPCTAPPPVGAGPLAAAANQIDDENFTFLDFTDVFCDTECHSVIGGIPIYYDNGHMNAPFARSFAPELARLGLLR